MDFDLRMLRLCFGVLLHYANILYNNNLFNHYGREAFHDSHSYEI